MSQQSLSQVTGIVMVIDSPSPAVGGEQAERKDVSQAPICLKQRVGGRFDERALRQTEIITRDGG